jgi:mannose-6-phosphate isomerase-like protein (cupin superfamily)
MKIRPWNRRDVDGADSCSRVLELWEVLLQHGESTPVHQHDDREELVIALEGRGEVRRQDVAVELFPGHGVVVPAGVTHSIVNGSGFPLRGLTVAIHRPSITVLSSAAKVSAGELELMIDTIPAQIDRPNALQAIIRLFETAGNLSEQIDEVIGLDTETGLRTLEDIEKQVMDAIVRIARAYEGGSNLLPPPF